MQLHSPSHIIMVSEMYQFLIATFILCCSEATSITLSPLGMVSVCPGGQVLLTCERVSGSFLYWDISIPQLAGTTTQRIIPSQGVLLSPDFKIGFTEFNITRTSGSPLISHLLINNVTTEINGSRVYCSEDGDENNAPKITINVVFKDDALRSVDHSLNVTTVNELLGNNDVTVTLQWPREAGVVYNINTLPEIFLSRTELTIMSHNTTTTNLTISYNVQYNVSIVSSLCGVTTTRVLKYVTCDHLPIQLLYRNAIVVTGPDSPPIEGQFITYACPSGFILTGPNASVCTGNREWEPDPGEVECIADCGVPLVDGNIKLNYSSTLEGSTLMLTCENDTSNINTTDEQILSVTCHTSGNWIPDPAQFTCSEFTTVPPGTISSLPGLSMNDKTPVNILLIILIPLITILTTIFFVLFLCGVKRVCVAKNSTSEDPNQQPTYEEIAQDHIKISMEGNAAYGHITHETEP